MIRQSIFIKRFYNLKNKLSYFSSSLFCHIVRIVIVKTFKAQTLRPIIGVYLILLKYKVKQKKKKKKKKKNKKKKKKKILKKNKKKIFYLF